MLLLASAIPTVRQKWSRGLRGVFTIYEADDGVALKRKMAKLKPSVLFLDLDLPQLGGIEDLSNIQPLSPSTRIILLTSKPDGKEATCALKAGAKGYCHKDIRPSLIKKAVEVVQKGEIWVGRNVIPRLLDELTSFTERRQGDPLLHSNVNLDCLTTRERQIARLIGNGSSNKEIAAQLNITKRTVKAHLTSVFFKLKISDRLHLALFVTEYDRATR
jgi:two-component system nitrate/nitrite response regulator NarL